MDDLSKKMDYLTKPFNWKDIGRFPTVPGGKNSTSYLYSPNRHPDRRPITLAR
jgi:hypothetical protein